MAERTVLLDATAEVRGAHLTLIANGTVAVVSAADFPPGKYPTDIVGRLIEDHLKYCPDICGTLEYPRTIPDKRQKANDVSDVRRRAVVQVAGRAGAAVRPPGPHASRRLRATTIIAMETHGKNRPSGNSRFIQLTYCARLPSRCRKSCTR